MTTALPSTAMLSLLPYHHTLLTTLSSPSTSTLLLLARGLGLRRVLCTLLRIFDSPQALVLLVNADPEEEKAVGEELGVMGCRRPGLRVVGWEMGRKERQELYKKGGLISVTSRILIVDMLQSNIPTHLITGVVVVHAEKATPTSLEAFILRLYREHNQTGFIKAFSDQPEQITSGLSPLRTIVRELRVTGVEVWPRFHESIKASLERRRADVVELYPALTESMREIHDAIVHCITTTVGELKRSNAELDLDDLTVENAYFRSFGAIIRRQLDSVWHKVGPRTKRLVNDLEVLRRLLTYLLTYDALDFHSYLETIVATNVSSGGPKEHQSPWLLTDAANVIFKVAKRRCYTLSAPSAEKAWDEDEAAWEALNEAEAVEAGINGGNKGKGKEREERPAWAPKGMDLMLEELPKWETLASVLHEIEQEMMRSEATGGRSFFTPGTNTVLVMTASTRVANLVSEYLSSMDPDVPSGQKGRKMMERKMHSYLWWKSKLGRSDEKGREKKGRGSGVSGNGDGVSDALKKKEEMRRERAAGRRRMRGGSATAAAVTQRSGKEKVGVDVVIGEGEMMEEADSIAEFLITQNIKPDGTQASALTTFDDDFALGLESDQGLDEFDSVYGLVPPQQTVVVRAYSDDTDDLMLAEIQPRFIVMFDPNQDFVRRIEVYRSSNPGLGVRVYFMVYRDSAEEHKYLVGLRREKEAFERLIRERGSMLMPILEERKSDSGDGVIRTISTRIAGGRREINKEPSQVIVDMREFRSSLPSLLHASKLMVVPATLTVGDYILTPDICVERKSIPDLVASFSSGRLYTQCELMSVHYKQPILLIEFEEYKSFSLESVADVKSYAKPTGKYPTKAKPGNGPDGETTVSTMSIQSKLVLLTLSFPRVRIIWSSSPYATVDIFNDLKLNAAEPNPSKAISVGAEEDPDAGAGVNAAAEELLRTFLGITAKNVKYVMSKVGSVRDLCDLSLRQVQDILGVDPGKACWDFLHQGERRS